MLAVLLGLQPVISGLLEIVFWCWEIAWGLILATKVKIGVVRDSGDKMVVAKPH